ncbi:hypothetical protein ACFQJ5_12195 [Halomicroarcula sp. GCM10025324]
MKFVRCTDPKRTLDPAIAGDQRDEDADGRETDDLGDGPAEGARVGTG